MEKPLFPPQTMYEIGGGDKHFCTYDFSILPDEQYEKFFNSLPNLLYKKIERVSFNCDFQFQYSNSGKTSVRKENLISDSIANKRPKFIPYLAKIFKFVLPKSKTLKGLEISSMHISRGLLSIMLSAISKSKSLESIVFKNVHFHDDYVIRFLQEISPYQFSEVSFISCGLTSRCFPAIKSFIRQRPKTSIIDRKLTTMNLDGCSLSLSELATIRNLISQGRNEDLTDGDGEPDITIDNNTIVTEDIPQPLPSPRRQLLLLKGSKMQSESKSSRSQAKSIESLQYQQMMKKETNSFKMESGKAEMKERSPSRRMKEPPEDADKSYTDDEESYEETSSEGYSQESPNLQNNVSVGSKQRPAPQISAPQPLVSSSGSSDQSESGSEEESYYSDYSGYSVESVESTVPNDTEEIAKQNERLKKELNGLMKQKHAVMYDDDVFLIGENIDEVVEAINDWKQQVQELENK